ncbi:Heterokaryon incompatibility protein 6, OR allele [Colletotrichum sp. SAR 10_86]|nr:Heterokaryon incompatibility protein 6, OR allele [Colletotrichum sp. SAR 10_86]
MSTYEDLKLISTVTTEHRHRHRLSEAHSDWEARAMRSRLFSGTEAQQPDSAAEDEAYVIVASPDMPSTEGAHHDQASAVTDPTLSSGTQLPESADRNDEQKEAQRDDMASPSDREGHGQRLINLAPSDCVAKAHRAALSRDAKNLSKAIRDQKTPGIVELVSSRTQSDQSPPGETNTTTTTTRGLRFLEAPCTFLLAHYVSYLLLTFPALIANLDRTDKTPPTLWQLSAFVAMYAILAVVRDKWMVYMRSDPEQREPEGTTTMAALRDFGTAVAAKAARSADNKKPSTARSSLHADGSSAHQLHSDSALSCAPHSEMDDATADFFQIAGEREYWTGYDIGREFELAKIDDHEWIPEETRAKVREWAKTKTVPVRPRDDGQQKPYRPIVDPYEIRVLEVKPGAKGDKLRGSLHHCSVEYVDPEPYNQSFIRVRYALSMEDLVTPISYTALSYTWGKPIFDAKIECDGHEKAITKSLESALLHFRREDESVVLWIDQICIDQDNNDEKGQQIPLMSRIYQRATNTAIWLGEAREGSDVAIKLLEEVNIRLQFTTEDDIDPEEFERMRLPEPDSHDWRALWKLLSRQWFTRVWIIQEVILSRDPWVACGDSLITWENLSSGCMQLVTTGISAWLRKKAVVWAAEEAAKEAAKAVAKEAAKGATSDSVTDDRDMCELAWQLHRMKQSAQDSDNTLVPLLVQSRGAQCYNSRDKVYGLLGVVNEDHQAAVKVSYADDFPAAKLYQQVVAHHVSQHPTRWALHEVLARSPKEEAG